MPQHVFLIYRLKTGAQHIVYYMVQCRETRHVQKQRNEEFIDLVCTAEMDLEAGKIVI